MKTLIKVIALICIVLAASNLGVLRDITPVIGLLLLGVVLFIASKKLAKILVIAFGVIALYLFLYWNGMLYPFWNYSSTF